jgi:hypothetical protein
MAAMLVLLCGVAVTQTLNRRNVLGRRGRNRRDPARVGGPGGPHWTPHGTGRRPEQNVWQASTYDRVQIADFVTVRDMSRHNWEVWLG